MGSVLKLVRGTRTRAVEQKNQKAIQQKIRFSDVATTHTMRRTAITTMLSLGVPEQVVRKISGHSPSGKEFYRYVLWAQTYQDQETEKMFNKLGEKRLMIENAIGGEGGVGYRKIQGTSV